MLLTITTTHRPATDLGYLLHKNPGKFQSFELAFGNAHVFYPEVSEGRCTAALVLDVDPVGLVRGERGEGLLDQYVNDRYGAETLVAVLLARASRRAVFRHHTAAHMWLRRSSPSRSRRPSAPR